MRACTQVRAFSFIFSTGGMRTPDRGSTTGAASWTDREPRAGCPQGRAKRVNPPHRHIRDESLYASTGFFFIFSAGGMRTPTGVRQLAQPVGQTASLRAGCPAGASEASQSPLTAIFKKSLYASTGFFSSVAPAGGMRTPTGFDNWQQTLRSIVKARLFFTRLTAQRRCSPTLSLFRFEPPGITKIISLRMVYVMH
jgi:hypothetical protein